MSAVALNDVWKKQCICPICHHLSESDMQQAGDDKLTRSDKIHHMDKKLNDPSPGVPSSHEARGEVRGGRRCPTRRKQMDDGTQEVKDTSEPGAPLRCSTCPTLCLKWLMWTAELWVPCHIRLCAASPTIQSVSPTLACLDGDETKKKKINPRDKRDVHESIMKTAEGVKKMK